MQEITPQEAFLSLVANTFATNILDSRMRAKEFESLGRLVPSVTIRQLCAHRDASRLTGLCDLLSDEAEDACIKVDAPSLRCALLNSLVKLSASLHTT